MILGDGKKIIIKAKSWRAWYSWSEEIIAEIMKVSGLNESDILCSVVTGYGRNKYEGCDLSKQTHMSCAKGSQNYFPSED